MFFQSMKTSAKRKTVNTYQFTVKSETNRGKLKMRFIEEVNSGKIFPNTDAEVNRINENRSSENKVKKRLYKPTIGIRKYKTEEETEQKSNQSCIKR